MKALSAAFESLWEEVACFPLFQNCLFCDFSGESLNLYWAVKVLKIHKGSHTFKINRNCASDSPSPVILSSLLLFWLLRVSEPVKSLILWDRRVLFCQSPGPSLLETQLSVRISSSIFLKCFQRQTTRIFFLPCWIWHIYLGYNLGFSVNRKKILMYYSDVF